MTLTRWSPVRDLASLEIERLNRMFEAAMPGEPIGRGTWVPPVDIFEDYEREGVVGRLADTLYSIMGYIPNFNPLLKQTAPKMIEKMKSEGVDAAFIIPV